MLLLDPMLATGGSAIAAIKVLIDVGVPEERIVFINLVCCPEGIRAMYKAYPKVFLTNDQETGLGYLMPCLFVLPDLGAHRHSCGG